MLLSGISLTICYFLFKYTTSWIQYYNKADERMPKSLWRYTCDYPVVGIRDISDLDDKPFVRLRRKRNKIVTIMYFIVVLAFIFSIDFVTGMLYAILN